MDLHEKIMGILQKEWEENLDDHAKTREKNCGIRSSQISALVKMLIELRVINIADIVAYEANRETKIIKEK